ncbi:MAG: 6-bladed beta-propeller [Bacteroidaceae bacterium]|nr:6-bladed beta-propeller [Bacteroidaceae bacterium]
MKKFKITFIILFLIVAITLIFTMGGKSNDDNNASFTHITDIATINWDCLNINNEEFKLSSIFSNYSLLSLENSKSSFIGEISKIEYYDSLLLVLDKKHLSKIFVFNNTDGKFYRTIGKIGQGPGEYLSLNDFSIDKENNKVTTVPLKSKIVL